jgi:hypothetical protein
VVHMVGCGSAVNRLLPAPLGVRYRTGHCPVSHTHGPTRCLQPLSQTVACVLLPSCRSGRRLSAWRASGLWIEDVEKLVYCTDTTVVPHRALNDRA